jgi:putative ABC transport system substrate-binding protein
MADPLALRPCEPLGATGRNITGVSAAAGLEVWGKRLGLLREFVPAASKAGFLASRGAAGSPEGIAVRDAAQRRGIFLVGPPL